MFTLCFIINKSQLIHYSITKTSIEMGKYLSLKVADMVQETADAVSLYFKTGFFSKLKYKSGQFLTLSVEIGGQEYLRAYSLNTAMLVDPFPSITIKRVQGGLVSNHILDTIHKGDKIKALQPRGNFVFEPNESESRHLVLVAGGSGITPILSIAKAALSKEPNTNISMVYCNKNEGSIIFNQKLNELKQKYPSRFELLHLLSEPTNNWKGSKGILTQDNIGGMVARFANWDKTKSQYYVCGPEGLMNATKEGLLKMGVSTNRIHLESFTACSSLVDGNDEVFEDKMVNLVYKGKTIPVNVPGNKSILDVALENGVNIPYSCCSGSCGTCMAKKKSGDVKMIGGNVLSDKEMEQGYILTCVGHPVSDNVTIEIE